MKFFIITKRHIIFVLILTVIAISAGIPLSQSIVSASAKKLPVYCVGREDKVISFSFDAAWDDADTPQLIEIFNKYNVKTTFFVVGEWVDKYPDSVKAFADAGHEIMNHSDTHPHIASLSKEQMKKEIVDCNKKIKAVTGKEPDLHRGPYGEYNNLLIDTLSEMNMLCIQWDIDSLDWKDLSADEIYNRVVPKVRPGSIILFHNGAKHTPEALPKIIEQLQTDGYKIVPVSENIYRDGFTLNHEGRQIKTS